MSAQAVMTGARLAYVVVPIVGTVRREKHLLETKAKNKDGKATMIETKVKKHEEPFGFMVYFPRGHAIRIRDEAQLRHYNLDGPPKFINMQGLEDPNSPVGKLMRAQDENERKGIMSDLERNVVQMVETRVGKVIAPGDVLSTDKVHNKEAA